jgi:TetR/AcrR family transcriptional regulator
MRKVRDLERTREAIFKAGLAEFSAKGLAGARTDAIARRAGVNKRMLFYCFGSKEGLYHAVLKRKIEAKGKVIESLSDDLVTGLPQIYDEGCADLDWVRMMEWEALASNHRAPVGEEDRRELFESALNKLRATQRKGGFAPDADLSHLFISMLAVSIFPLAFPQIIRLATGMAPTDPNFKVKHREFLRWLGERLKGAQAVQADPRAKTAAAVGSGKRRNGSKVPSKLSANDLAQR